MDPENFSVKLNEAGAQAAPAAPPAPTSPGALIDAKGRRLVLRELSLLEEQDLIAAMPPNHAANQLVLGRALMAARIAEIDGDRLEVPLSALQYRAMLARVGKEGLAAVYGTLPRPATDSEEQDAGALAKN